MPRRTRGQREKDLILTEALYLRGWSLRRIARELLEKHASEISHKQVVKDISEIQRRWREDMGTTLAEMKGGEVAMLKKVREEAWDEWHRSKEPIEKKTGERRETSGGEEPEAAPGATPAKAKATPRPRTHTSTRVEKIGRLGDSNYLNVIVQCSDRVVKLLGLEQVQAVDDGQLTTEDIVRLALSPGGYGAVPGTMPPEAYLERHEAERLLAEQSGVTPVDDADADD